MQKLIVEITPKKFAEAVNNHLLEGWTIVPHTSEAVWKDVSMGGQNTNNVTSDAGFFSMVLDDSEVPEVKEDPKSPVITVEVEKV